MLKRELVATVAATNPHLHAKDIERAVNAILEEITAALVRRDRIELRRFGSFAVNTWGPRIGRNPKTGAAIDVPETHHPAFRVAIEMNAELLLRQELH
jgi:integration host factor subunit beta